ncbi:MAG: hypothetical protein ABIP06_01960 [Pyrinomonadaceae bacterium]
MLNNRFWQKPCDRICQHRSAHQTERGRLVRIERISARQTITTGLCIGSGNSTSLTLVGGRAVRAPTHRQSGIQCRLRLLADEPSALRL